MFTLLNSMFTKNQIKLLLGMQKQVLWTSEEISLAFTLRYFSKRCFLFLKRKLKIPLPGLSTLQRWASRFEINQGIFESVLKKIPNIPKEVLKTFLRQRTFIRIKFLNEESTNKRKSENDIEKRKQTKKC